MAEFDTVEEYLAALPNDVRARLQTALDRAQSVVPDPGLVISYQMPTVTSAGGRVAHLAGWKAHLAIYPVPADASLAEELTPYLSGKSSLRFPLRQPIPYELIERVVAALHAEQAP